MLGAEVDLIFRAVQPEVDRTLGGAAVDVIDEQGLYLLGHGCSIPRADWRTILETLGSASVWPHRYVDPSLPDAAATGVSGSPVFSHPTLARTLVAVLEQVAELQATALASG
jgi:hypothetical protein